VRLSTLKFTLQSMVVTGNEALIGKLDTRRIMDLTLFTHPPIIVGDGPHGRRVDGYIKGGHFEGIDGLNGEVMPVGGDWLVIRADGARMLDVRTTLRCVDGATINLTYAGRWLAEPGYADEAFDRERSHLIDPSKYSIRAAMAFETGAKPYTFLNDALVIGLGRRIDGGVRYVVHEVLERYRGD
jgi:hypothetical protein